MEGYRRTTYTPGAGRSSRRSGGVDASAWYAARRARRPLRKARGALQAEREALLPILERLYAEYVPPGDDPRIAESVRGTLEEDITHIHRCLSGGYGFRERPRQSDEDRRRCERVRGCTFDAQDSLSVMAAQGREDDLSTISQSPDQIVRKSAPNTQPACRRSGEAGRLSHPPAPHHRCFHTKCYCQTRRDPSFRLCPIIRCC